MTERGEAPSKVPAITLGFGIIRILVTTPGKTSWANRVLLFCAAFILTRPPGAAVGESLDKPVAKGGVDPGRPAASLMLGAAILLLTLLLPQRPEGHPEMVRAGK